MAQARGSVAQGGASPLKIARFDDPRLKSGLFLLRLLSALDKDVVELTFEQAMPSEDQKEEQAEANARQVIESTLTLTLTLALTLTLTLTLGLTLTLTLTPTPTRSSRAPTFCSSPRSAAAAASPSQSGRT